VESRWYFPSTEGNHWHPDTFGEKIREINEAHGLSWSCGDYRHTFGSHLAMKGVSLYKISSLMGNSPDICRKHYAALVPQEMREEVEFASPAAGGPDPRGGSSMLMQQLLQRLELLERTQKPQEPPALRIAK
jgi:site-specific recombinase XerD